MYRITRKLTQEAFTESNTESTVLNLLFHPKLSNVSTTGAKKKGEREKDAAKKNSLERERDYRFRKSAESGPVVGARWRDESSRKVGAAGISLFLSLPVCLPLCPACETDRGKEGEGRVASCAGNGQPKAARYSRACVRAYVGACVRACVRVARGARLYIEALGWPRATVEVYGGNTVAMRA